MFSYPSTYSLGREYLDSLLYFNRFQVGAGLHTEVRLEFGTGQKLPGATMHNEEIQLVLRGGVR